MDPPKHLIISSEVIYVWQQLQIIVSVCESLVKESVFLCLTRRNSAANYDFYLGRNIASKLPLKLPGALEFSKTLPKTITAKSSDGWFSEVTKRLLASNDKKEYYLGIKQSNLFGSYYMSYTP